MYYKDDFNVTFKEESAFYRYLDDVEKRAEWFRAQSKNLKVEAVTKDSICYQTRRWKETCQGLLLWYKGIRS